MRFINYFTLLALLSLSLLTATTGRCQSNMVLFVSASGDYIGGGTTYVTTDTSQFSFSGSASKISAGAFGFGFTFSPGTGSLTVGTYNNATRWPFNGSGPGIDISGNGRGCNNECGRFQILEFHTDSNGNVDRLWLTYSNTCECSMAPMTGEIRYHSTLAPNPGQQVFLVPSQYATIQSAINAASFSPTSILVSPGTYAESLTYGGKPIKLVGLGGASQTILAPPSGQNGINFTGSETSNSIITGFTISGVVTSMSAIFCDGTSPLISSNLIVNCGNGIYCNYGASPTVLSNYIARCSGTAFYAVNGGTSPLVQGNIIQSNANCIFSAYGASPTFLNNYILHNTGNAISGFNGSAVNIIQNVIAYNTGSAVSYPVPYGDRGPYCINNTVVGNGAGFGISGFSTSSEIINNIVVGPMALNAGGPMVWNNDFYNPAGSAYSGGASNLTGINGNISADPMFACIISEDFRLYQASPAIDAGSNGAPYLLSTDIIGNPRSMGAKVDMGAFEADPANLVTPCMFVECPGDILANAVPGQTNVVVNYPAPTYTPGATIVSVPPSGSTFPAGTNTVTCTATYGTNSATCSFTITVVGPPALTNTLVETNVLAGQSFSLAVSPLGSAPFTYQWYFGNTPISGATTNSLTIANAQQANEGLYQVAVFNSAGGFTNVVATVRVQPTRPTIWTHPASLALPASSNATFQVAATGSQPLTYQWFFNNTPITGATTAQLSLSGIQSNNSGSYYVVVSNALGSVKSASATLTVTPLAPYFTTQPIGGTISGGASRTLTGIANGSLPISYQWQHNSTNIPGATQSSLMLTSLSTNDSGPYVLIASNIAGTTNSSVAQLTVLQNPSLVSTLTNQIVDAGSNVVLSVNVLGASPIGYSWRLNGQPIAGTNSALSITNIQPSQTGFYSVIITNSYGTISSTCRVSVLEPISTVIAWGDNSGGQLNVPPSLADAVAVAGGDYHSLVLRHDGTLLAWGYDGNGQTNAPTNAQPFVAIASGTDHCLAITESGSLVAWGRNDFGQCNVPVGTSNGVLAVAAGDDHSLALMGNGSVIAWGNNTYGQTSVSQLAYSGITAIAAGRVHSLALRTNGTVVGWGYNAYGQALPPAGLSNVVAITAGYLHSAALLSNKTVVVWGDNSFGQTNVPAGLSNVIAIAAGDFNTSALLANGKMVSWGDDTYGQTDVPGTLTNAVTVASGNYHGLALVPTAGVLLPSVSPNGLVLKWTGNAKLQWSPSPTGPFQDVPMNGNCYTNTGMAGAKFFRLRR